MLSPCAVLAVSIHNFVLIRAKWSSIAILYQLQWAAICWTSHQKWKRWCIRSFHHNHQINKFRSETCCSTATCWSSLLHTFKCQIPIYYICACSNKNSNAQNNNYDNIRTLNNYWPCNCSPNQIIYYLFHNMLRSSLLASSFVSNSVRKVNCQPYTCAHIHCMDHGY